ncbi:cell division protein SepF [Subtercola boreus]|uniref:Cell division protein SepF n=1 Tax=Subtercola boreus TaxID=120213 RepID=A0A3E0WDD9_9MICO|nr:cell division protein SepF [Subtercola boreus]RFA21099.1 cell division protein SepF [Subtercola boreus]RFA21482.1 cell division protein SepF [Subtercola boreus]RFA27453.1 cell division protein SepF [Subtercola boreus]
MANPLRKTMVYLGLADEELDYEETQAAPTAHVAHPQAAQPAGDRPVAYAAPPSARAESNAGRAPVTPLRRNTIQKNAAPLEMNEILTVHPKQYKDAQIIAESFREGIPVIINLSQMTDADARRLIDFAGGLSQGLYGKIERVTSKVFLLSPSHVSVSGEAQTDTRTEASFFVQS